MVTSFRALDIRTRLGKHEWQIPRQFGPDGWVIDMNTVEQTGRIIVTAAPYPQGTDFEDWWHASISFPDHMPTYDDLVLLKKAIWPNGWAYQCFAPSSAHVNIHEFALHLYGRPDGRAILPNFGIFGTI
jgi:hypothetical protein